MVDDPAAAVLGPVLHHVVVAVAGALLPQIVATEPESTR